MSTAQEVTSMVTCAKQHDRKQLNERLAVAAANGRYREVKTLVEEHEANVNFVCKVLVLLHNKCTTGTLYTAHYRRGIAVHSKH